MNLKFDKLIFSFFIICLSTFFAKEKIIYKEDFETNNIFTEWTTIITNPIWQNPIKTDITPKGNRRFLGQFGNQDIILTLANKYDLCDFNIDFDVFVIRSWDGGDSTLGDIFAFDVNGTNIAYSFSNWGDSATSYGYQSYPETVNSGKKYPAQYGAIEKQSLGYIYEPTPIAEDAVYHLSMNKTNISRIIKIKFMGILKDGTPTFDNESWGIDNIIIKVNEIDLTCSLPDTFAFPGTENFRIPLLAKVNCENEFTKNLSFTANIKFNASMFLPSGLTTGVILENLIDKEFNRIITIRCDNISLNETNSILTEITGTVLLGESFTPLEILEFKWVNSNINIDTVINGSLETKACALPVRRVKLFNQSSFSIKPNPVNDELSISFSNVDLSNKSISIFNSLGIEIKRLDEKELSGQSSINLSTEVFPSGIYFCSMNTGTNRITKSFVVIR